MRHIIVLVLVLFSTGIMAQVGINTTTPESSSILDISATDKGILIPRVSLSDVTDTMIDGVNTAATGLLIYNTNSSTVGGSGEGYYYFNGTIWERMLTNASEDDDWYKSGTTMAPTSINDSIFTQGNLTIGETTTPYKFGVHETNTAAKRVLNIQSTNASDTLSSSIYNEVFYTGIDTLSTTYNLVTGSGTGNVIGTFNDMKHTGSGRHFGVYNRMDSVSTDFETRKYGIYQDLFMNSASGVVNVGIRNRFSGVNVSRTQMGVDNRFDTWGSGIHIGVRNQGFSETSGSKYGVLNNYGGGDGSKIGVWNAIFHSAVSPIYGIFNDLGNFLGSGNLYGMYTDLESDGSGDYYGSYTDIPGAGSGVHYGAYHWLGSTGTGTKYGTYNRIQNTAGGTHYGVYSDVQKTADNSYAGYFIGNFIIDDANNTFFVNSVNNRVGIGTDTPSFQLQVSTNSAAKPTSPDWMVPSDARLKANVHPFIEGLALLRQINPVWYTYNGKGGLPQEAGIGTMAQEIQKIAPYMITPWNYESDEGVSETYLGIDYGPLYFIMINSIKEQQQIIEQQREEIDALKGEIELIKELIKNK